MQTLLKKVAQFDCLNIEIILPMKDIPRRFNAILANLIQNWTTMLRRETTPGNEVVMTMKLIHEISLKCSAQRGELMEIHKILNVMRSAHIEIEYTWLRRKDKAFALEYSTVNEYQNDYSKSYSNDP